MRRLLSSAAAVAFAALAVPAAGIAASPSPSPAASPSASASPSPSASAHPSATSHPSATPSSAPVVLPSCDAIDQQLAQALAQQQQLDATKLALAQEIGAANQTVAQLNQLMLANQQQIQATMVQVDLEQRNLADATVREAAAQARAEDAQARAATDRFLLAAIVRQEYEQPDGYVAYVLAGDSIQSMMDRAAEVRSIVSRASDLVQHLRDEQTAAEEALDEAHADEMRAQAAATALQAQQQTLAAETANEQSIVAQLGSQADAASRELGAIDSQDAAVAQQVAELRIEQLDRTIADAEQAAWDQAQYYLQNNLTGLPDSAIPGADPRSVGAVPAGASEQAPTGAKPFMWPAPGSVVSQVFGPSSNAFEPPAFGFPHFHTGIDMAAPTGTRIFAAAAGVVVAATPGSTGYGNHIIIASDKHVLCLYGHLETMLVHPGETVTQGQLIGLMGSTGNSTGSHLHFEVRVDNTPVNPAPLLGPEPPAS